MRKIDSLRFIRLCGLYTPEAEEFTAEQTDAMIDYAKSLQQKYGNFNLRTDSPKGSDKISMNHPFVKFCSIEQLNETVRQHGNNLSYIIHQPIDDNTIICNGAGFLDGNKIFFAEVNFIDKTTQREAMKNAEHLHQVIVGCGHRDIALEHIRKDLIKHKIGGVVEFSIFEDGTPVYWQVRDKH